MTNNILEAQLDQAAKHLADDIDFEVLSQAFCESGWTKVVLSPMTWEQSDMIDIWTSQHVKGHMITRGLVWVFEDPKEANWFTLRWA